jgi:hypothetical protein
MSSISANRLGGGVRAALAVVLATAAMLPVTTMAADLPPQARMELVKGLENILFQASAKSTTILFAKTYDKGDGSQRICGEALFGSARQNFILDTQQGLARAVTKAQWAELGCERQGATVLRDLR